MMIALKDVSDHMEEQGNKIKVEMLGRRWRREEGVLSESLALKREEAGCGFVRQIKAGLG